MKSAKKLKLRDLEDKVLLTLKELCSSFGKMMYLLAGRKSCLASGAWGLIQTWLDFGFAGEHDAEAVNFLLLHKLLPAWQTSELCSAPAQPETGGNNLSS